MTGRRLPSRSSPLRRWLRLVAAAVCAVSLGGLSACGVSPDASPTLIGDERLEVGGTDQFVVVTPLYFVVTGADGSDRLDSVPRRIVLPEQGTNDARADYAQALLDELAKGPTEEEIADGFRIGPVGGFLGADGATSVIRANFFDADEPSICSIDFGPTYAELDETEKLFLLGQVMLSIADFEEIRVNSIDLNTADEVFGLPSGRPAQERTVPWRPEFSGSAIAPVRGLPINRLHYLGLLYEAPTPATPTSGPATAIAVDPTGTAGTTV